jgi:hypothetical protein
MQLGGAPAQMGVAPLQPSLLSTSHASQRDPSQMPLSHSAGA